MRVLVVNAGSSSLKVRDMRGNLRFPLIAELAAPRPLLSLPRIGLLKRNPCHVGGIQNKVAAGMNPSALPL